MSAIPPNAVKLAKIFEGYSFKPYICPGGYWTGGFGHMFRPPSSRRNLPIGEAEQILFRDIYKALSAVIRHCPILLRPEHRNKLGAIVDFTFNLGAGRLQTSTLRRVINRQDWPGAADQLNRWVYAGGRKLRGLVRRRAAEAAYFRSA